MNAHAMWHRWGRCHALVLVVYFLICLQHQPLAEAYQSPLKQWTQKVQTGYQQRVAADPSFAQKSVTEVLLAAGTQFTAEWNRRGAARLLPEMDFVVPAILTAVIGKYYSMWRVAKTLEKDDGAANSNNNNNHAKAMDIKLGNMPVPTNAFQPFLLDGVTRPTFVQRLGSLIAPVWPLFRAGFLTSSVGYGVVSLLIVIRSILFPLHVAATKPVNVLYASLYTGCFLAVVSNIRYQLLQGVVEPLIDRLLRGRRLRVVRSAAILAVRWANGLLGSILAITGMQALGLQKLK